MMADLELPEKSKERLLRMLERSVKSNAPKGEFGILFSGGIDSVLLALLCKRAGLKFSCFFGFLDGLGEPKDLAFAKRAADFLDVKLELAPVSMESLPKLIGETISLIGSTNPVQVSVALPLLAACSKAKQMGIKTVFSGMGADELFCGYAKFRNAVDIAFESMRLVQLLPENDLKRDLAIASHCGLEIRAPYLNSEILRFALSLPKNLKLSGQRNKIILRELAVSIGLPKELAERKKVAAQYGSNFDKGIERLAKKAKAKGKRDFLEGFAKKPEIAALFSGGEANGGFAADARCKRIAALFSGGKDSCLALWLMQQKGFGVECLVSVIPKNPDSFMYHKPGLAILKMQSGVLGIPLVIERTAGVKEKELAALKKALSRAKKEFGIEGVCSGALYSNYQRERIQGICDSLGLLFFSPLWHMDQVAELKMLVDSGFVFIVSKVAGLGKDWLGRRIGGKEIAELESLGRKNGLHPAGEGGEFESLVLDAPNFSKRIAILSMKKNIQSGLNGSIEIGDAGLESK
ncbi:MAG: diphthine--ammonia ligase [archaeon]